MANARSLLLQRMIATDCISKETLESRLLNEKTPAPLLLLQPRIIKEELFCRTLYIGLIKSIFMFFSTHFYRFRFPPSRYVLLREFEKSSVFLS